MGEQIKQTSNEAVERWHKKMPRFFRWMMYLCGLVVGTAVAVNTFFNSFGIQPHEWWTDILPYLTGVPFGMMFAAKFTCDGGFRDKSMGSLDGHTILDKDDN
jgi:hypothetical protein